MVNPRYETVRGYATVGDRIVAAYELPGYTLTGLLVDMPVDQWRDLDMLEAGYKRVKVETTSGHEAYMYVGRTRYSNLPEPRRTKGVKSGGYTS